MTCNIQTAANSLHAINNDQTLTLYSMFWQFVLCLSNRSFTCTTVNFKSVSPDMTYTMKWFLEKPADWIHFVWQCVSTSHYAAALLRSLVNYELASVWKKQFGPQQGTIAPKSREFVSQENWCSSQHSNYTSVRTAGVPANTPTTHQSGQLVLQPTLKLFALWALLLELICLKCKKTDGSCRLFQSSL
jgi:hypothetical protein